MKKLSRAKKVVNPALAALLLSAFSFGTNAHAEILEKQGVSANELINIIPDFKVSQNGLNVNFFGEMPARCAEGARLKRYANTFMFVMPNCDKDFTAVSGEDTVDVSDVFKTIALEDLSGKVMIRHLPRGSAKDTGRAIDEELKDSSGKTIELQSSADLAAEETKKQDEANAARAKKESEALVAKLGLLCKKGDYVGLGEEIQNASSYLGDVSDLLEKIDMGQMQKYKKDLQSAKDAEEARTIFEQYQAISSEKAWDQEYLNDLYIEKRFSFIEDMRTDNELGSSEIAKEIRDWKSELRGIDSKKYREHKKDFAIAYGDLFAREVDKGNLDEAVKYANKAKELSPSSDAEKFDAKLASIYTEKFKECVEKGPWKVESCEKKYANKGQSYADSVKSSMANRAKGGDEEAQEEYASFLSEYTQTYGAGMSYNYSGFGKVSQQPGIIQQYKQQQLMQYQQQQQMQYQQQMMQQYQSQMYGGNMMMGYGMR